MYCIYQVVCQKHPAGRFSARVFSLFFFNTSGMGSSFQWFLQCFSCSMYCFGVWNVVIYNGNQILNYLLIWKLHRFVLYEVVSKASRGSLLQPWFIRFLVFFNPMFSENEFFFWMQRMHSPTNTVFSTLRSIHKSRKQRAVASAKLEQRLLDQRHCRSSPLRSTLNTGYITGLDMCKVCTEAVHCVALWTRVTLQVWTCVKYVPKQSIA